MGWVRLIIWNYLCGRTENPPDRTGAGAGAGDRLPAQNPPGRTGSAPCDRLPAKRAGGWGGMVIGRSGGSARQAKGQPPRGTVKLHLDRIIFSLAVQ
jgi:hypothetical protein